jgi:hypothetical protein
MEVLVEDRKGTALDRFDDEWLQACAPSLCTPWVRLPLYHPPEERRNPKLHLRFQLWALLDLNQ